MRLGEAAEELYQFVGTRWLTFISKKSKCKANGKTLELVLDTCLRLLHPLCLCHRIYLAGTRTQRFINYALGQNEKVSDRNRNRLFCNLLTVGNYFLKKRVSKKRSCQKEVFRKDLQNGGVKRSPLLTGMHMCSLLLAINNWGLLHRRRRIFSGCWSLIRGGWFPLYWRHFFLDFFFGQLFNLGYDLGFIR